MGYVGRGRALQLKPSVILPPLKGLMTSCGLWSEDGQGMDVPLGSEEGSCCVCLWNVTVCGAVSSVCVSDRCSQLEARSC